MPRVDPDRFFGAENKPRPDRTEKILRFGCGVVPGLVLGIVALDFLADYQWFVQKSRPLYGVFATPKGIAFLVGTALLSGFAATRMGDRFYSRWYGLSLWLFPYRRRRRGE